MTSGLRHHDDSPPRRSCALPLGCVQWGQPLHHPPVGVDALPVLEAERGQPAGRGFARPTPSQLSLLGKLSLSRNRRLTCIVIGSQCLLALLLPCHGPHDALSAIALAGAPSAPAPSIRFQWRLCSLSWLLRLPARIVRAPTNGKHPMQSTERGQLLPHQTLQTPIGGGGAADRVHSYQFDSQRALAQSDMGFFPTHGGSPLESFTYT